ncbi:MAG: helix-turn-helix transcriptional regulator [Planctomycetes bacterium]|nr:helix-turn-helix transcriptional regulator [Planctomycetota bacterium]
MSIAPNRPLFRIRERAQVEALASPARQEVVDGLQAIGPCSIAALAQDLGRAPDSLYYHVRLLEQSGLVVRRGTRATGRRAEALFDVPGRMVLDQEPRTQRERRALEDVVAAALRIGERDFRAAIDAGRARTARGPRRNTWGGRMKGWLTETELRAARAHVEALSELLARGRKRPGAELYAIAFALAPLAPSTRSRAGAGPTTKPATSRTRKVKR